jgi:hypothetical protein
MTARKAIRLGWLDQPAIPPMPQPATQPAEARVIQLEQLPHPPKSEVPADG